MHYVPGSHRGGRLLEHRRRTGSDIVLNEELSPEAFDFRAARDDRLDAGQFSLHDVLLVHGSNANRSPRRRAGFVIRFMPATSLFDRKVDQRQQQVGVSFSFTRRPIWLVRGVDRAGNDFGAGHGEDYRLVPRRSDDA